MITKEDIQDEEEVKQEPEPQEPEEKPIDFTPLTEQLALIQKGIKAISQSNPDVKSSVDVLSRQIVSLFEKISLQQIEVQRALATAIEQNNLLMMQLAQVKQTEPIVIDKTASLNEIIERMKPKEAVGFDVVRDEWGKIKSLNVKHK